MTLPLSAFFELLKVQARDFMLDAPQGLDRTRGGSTIVSRYGDLLWRGTITIPPASTADAASTLALLEYVYSSMEPFLAYDTAKPGPRMDPTGALIAASTPLVRTVASDRRTMTLKGLPAGYILSRGDLIGVAYSGRRWLGRVFSVAVTAAGNGNTPDIALSMPLPVGIGPDNAVTLYKPAIKVKLLEPSFGSAAPLISSGISFQFQQDMDPDA